MGYLTDNTTIGAYGRIGDCPDLYPYALVVRWNVNDRFHAPKPIQQVMFEVKDVLPDVEDWQCSVLRPRENRAKLRFKDAATRLVARNKLSLLVGGPISIRDLVDLDPPDRVQRGLA